MTKKQLNHETETLKDDLKLIDRSVSWWERELNKVITEFDGLDSFAPDYSSRLEKLIAQMQNLVRKGKAEKLELDKWEERMQTLKAINKRKK